jgi:hypothetical protein
MNKYLMLTAAALLSSATTVEANTFCFQFSGDSCDGGRLSTGVDGGALSGTVRAWVHTNNNCAGGTSQGYGFLAKTPGLGKVSLMSDDFFAKNYGTYSIAVSWNLPKRIENGAPWSVWIGMDGVTFFEDNSGVFVNAGKCHNRAPNHGRKSTLDSVRELVRAHRTSKPLSE